MAIPMLKIRRPLGRPIFNMGIAIPGKTVFLIETAPCVFHTIHHIILQWSESVSEKDKAYQHDQNTNFKKSYEHRSVKLGKNAFDHR